MALRGYTNPDKVAEVLGVALTPGQIHLAEWQVIPAVEEWIDGETGRAWLTGVVTDEAHYHPGPNLYLRRTPVASVASVTARVGMGDAGTALVVGSTYEVRSLTTGWLYLPAQDPEAIWPGLLAPYDRVLVTYTPNTGLPANIGLAAGMLAAHWMGPQLHGVPAGIAEYSVGGELRVKYSDLVAELGVPAEVMRLVGRRRRWRFA